MKVHVVTEGPFDADLLQRILPEDVRRNASFWPAQGRSSGLSIARSLLATRAEPVVLVLDSDSTDEETVDEQRQIVEEFLHDVSSRGEVQLAVPEIEIVFFQDRDALQRLLGEKQISEVDWAVGQEKPKDILEKLLGQRSLSELLALLDQRKVKAALGRHPLVVEIAKSICRLGRNPSEGAAAAHA